MSIFNILLSTALANPPLESTLPEFGLEESETPDHIINGNDADTTDFPMTGAMLMTGDAFGFPLKTFVCSSTLIAPDTVITAAHCLDTEALTMGIPLDNLEFYWTRQSDLSSWDGTSQNPELPTDAIQVVDWVMHEDFDIQMLQLGLAENSDIALLFLAEPILDIEPAYLPTATEAAAIAEGDAVSVVGWGQQIATGYQEAPPAGSYSFKQQGESYISLISEYEFKVGEEVDDVRKCHGDSGGPTFWEAEDGLRLIGVTSHAYDYSDCFETGGVDTRIDYYFDWITSNMEERCADGTRVWCEEPGIISPNYFAPEEEEEDKGLFSCSTAKTDFLFYLPLFGLLGVSRRRS